jgi:choline dehydrogenase-like flavoprotein
LFAFLPALEGMPRHNSDGTGAPHLYFPWWLQDAKGLGFARGYHLQMGGGYYMPEVGNISPLAYFAEGYGERLHQAIRASYGTLAWLTGFGEMVPNRDSYCEIDPGGMKDRFGIPVLRFHWKWGSTELEQTGHMYKTARDILEAAGGKVLGGDPAEPNSSRISTGGAGIHELGCIRMGDDKGSAPLNKWCQAHESANLFVADGGPFVSNPEKNPTLTIIALAWRTAEYVAEAMRRGDV